MVIRKSLICHLDGKTQWLFGKGAHLPNVIGIRDLSLHKRKERAAYETLMRISLPERRIAKMLFAKGAYLPFFKT